MKLEKVVKGIACGNITFPLISLASAYRKGKYR